MVENELLWWAGVSLMAAGVLVGFFGALFELRSRS
jgi:hypothetical protein